MGGRPTMMGIFLRQQEWREDEEQDSEDETDREIHVVRRLMHGDPDGRGEHECDADAVQELFFHHLALRECQYSRKCRTCLP